MENPAARSATDPDPLDRIERALARIETAATARGDESVALVRRNEALRAHIGDAIAALDAVIAREDGG